METEILAPAVIVEASNFRDNKYWLKPPENGIPYRDLCANGDKLIISVPDGVNSVKQGAFKGCDSLIEVRFPRSLTMISTERGISGSTGAFQECKSLSNIVFPPDSTLNIIGKSAFEQTALTEVRFPTSLTMIGNNAFAKCPALTNIIFPQDCSLNTISTNAFVGCKRLTEIRFPPALTTISDHAFMDCTSLTSVRFPEGSAVTTIPQKAFNGCRSLIEVEFPSGLTKIRTGAFRGCESLTQLHFPQSLASVEDGGFNNCKKVKEIYCSSAQIGLPWGDIITEGYPARIIKGIVLVCPGTLTTVGGDQYPIELRIPLNDKNYVFDPETQVLSQNVPAEREDQYDIMYESNNLRDLFAEVIRGRVDFNKLDFLWR